MKQLPSADTHLDEAQAHEVFGWILDGETSDEEIGRFLVDMSSRSETSDEIAGAARALRERLLPVEAPEGTVDCCGTGGDGHHTLNVSTAVSLLVAACGVPVAKHGNRAASSKSGAADTLEALACAAGFLMLPLVNCINHTNQDDSAYRHNSRWRVYHYLLTLLAIPLCVITLGGETGLTPSDRVIDGSKLLSHDIKFLQRKGVIVPDEKIIYFYSDAFLSNRDDGNGYTERKVFSYWQDESGFNLHTAAYADIKNIEVTWGDIADHTIVKI
ncbi:MAG: hypothetical protein ACM308_02685, partial [Qipengyuania vulgaris]